MPPLLSECGFGLAPLRKSHVRDFGQVSNGVLAPGEVLDVLRDGTAPEDMRCHPGVDLASDLEPVVPVVRPVLNLCGEVRPRRLPGGAVQPEGRSEAPRETVRKVEADEHPFASGDCGAEQFSNAFPCFHATGRVFDDVMRSIVRAQRADPDGVLAPVPPVAGAPVNHDVPVEERGRQHAASVRRDVSDQLRADGRSTAGQLAFVPIERAPRAGGAVSGVSNACPSARAPQASSAI